MIIPILQHFFHTACLMHRLLRNMTKRAKSAFSKNLSHTEGSSRCCSQIIMKLHVLDLDTGALAHPMPSRARRQLSGSMSLFLRLLLFSVDRLLFHGSPTVVLMFLFFENHRTFLKCLAGFDQYALTQLLSIFFFFFIFLLFVFEITPGIRYSVLFSVL